MDQRLWSLRWLLRVLCCLMVLSHLAVAQLSVDESKIRFHMVADPSFEFPFHNGSNIALTGKIRLELLDAYDKVDSFVEGTITSAPGDTPASNIPMPASRLPSHSPSELAMERLHYVLTPSEGGQFPALEGYLQLSEIMADAFEVKSARDYAATLGGMFPVQVRVADPRTGRPYGGQSVEFSLELGDEDHVMKRAVLTDANGYASTTFQLPHAIPGSSPTLTVKVQRGPFSEEITDEVRVFKYTELILTTDKRIYQPGQTLHLRVQALRWDRHVMAAKPVKITIETWEGEQAEYLRQTVTTSAYGIASLDWQIPDKVRLGDYSIHADVEEDDEGDEEQATKKVKISRYELPTFSVTIKPEKPYYFPGDKVHARVAADYLTGQPVKRGLVKVAWANTQKWNEKTGKWEEDPTRTATAELDVNGRAQVELPLGDLGVYLKEATPNDPRRYTDESLVAYVTDGSTGRQQQRRAQIRITAEPIHVYAFTRSYAASERTLPGELFVTTAYADGTPASVPGSIALVVPDGADSQENLKSLTTVPFLSFRTNRYGIAKITLPVFEAKYLQPYTDYGYQDHNRREKTETVGYSISVEDDKGLQGHLVDWEKLISNNKFFEVLPERVLLRQGEEIRLTLLSNTTSRDVVIEVSNQSGSLLSRVVRLHNGTATVLIPFDRRFKGEINATGYVLLNPAEHDRWVSDTATVLYPAKTDLDVETKIAPVLKPGQSADLEINVKSPSGSRSKSALGVLVYDKSVAERVEQDEDLAGDYGYSRGRLGWQQRNIGGVGYEDLLKLDSTQPYPAEFELIADALASHDGGRSVEISGGEGFDMSPLVLYSKRIQEKLQPAIITLESLSALQQEYPHDVPAMNKVLREHNVDAAALLDPWGMPYRPELQIDNAEFQWVFFSNGPDKKRGTSDDFEAARSHWTYFSRLGGAIDVARINHELATGVYINDYDSLREILKDKQGIDLDAIKDPWGRPYKYEFRIEGASYDISITSAGPDGVFEAPGKNSKDDVFEWTSYLHYFINQTTALYEALGRHFAETKTFPRNETEMAPVLQSAGLTPEKLKDPWGNPYRFVFGEQVQYTNRTEIRDGHPVPVPVTEKLETISVITHGPQNDPKQSFLVAGFNRAAAEQAANQPRAQASQGVVQSNTMVRVPGGRGGLSGVVQDSSGAVVPSTKVTVSGPTGTKSDITDQEGRFQFPLLPPGFYALKVEKQSFKTTDLKNIEVVAGKTTSIHVMLQVAGSTEVVEVSASAVTVNTTSTAISGASVPGTATAGKQLFTPRVRKYFPETLLWQPEVITDARGKARIRFPLADTITAWKLSVMASTQNGEMGWAEKEFKTFQPFFVESDTPKVLTVGDVIEQPVILRNYMQRPQHLVAQFENSDLFKLRSPSRLESTVEAGDDGKVSFTYQALRAVREGAVTITARSVATGDSVQQKIAVHPDGREVPLTRSQVLAGERVSFEIPIPEDAVPDSADAELRIYPNLTAHIFDAMRAVGEQPAGCNEQVTSVGFVNLVALRVLRRAHMDDPADALNPRAEIAKKARQAVQETYSKILIAQRGDGGFGYWQDWDSDPALTAYVLRFLIEAKDFLPSEEPVRLAAARKARTFVVGKQLQDGAWPRLDRVKKTYTESDMNVTAYVLQALAEALPETGIEERTKLQHSIALGMDRLEKYIDAWQERASGPRDRFNPQNSWPDPYLIGNYSIVAGLLNDGARENTARSLLGLMAHREGDTAYWNLEANATPFNGWGGAGRIETTALAVRALAMMQAKHPEPATGDSIRGGLQFLLQHKDRYSGWYSTQASDGAVEALASLLPLGEERAPASTARVTVNDRHLADIHIPAAQTVADPIVLELGTLRNGSNAISLTRTGVPGEASFQSVSTTAFAAMNVQALTSFYLPWKERTTEDLKAGETRALRLQVGFDQHAPRVDETVKAHVEAERIGFEGYGMMLAEIGIPPGAEVDRESLEQARNVGVSDFDVLPDRVVFYLWPAAGGLKFDFTFRMRYKVDALTSQSLLYDYYNPESRAVVAPVRFTMR